MIDILRMLAGFELFALTLGFWAFTLLFHVLANWSASAMGRHFMSFMICCDLIMGWSWVVFVIDPSMSVRIWVALFLYGALAIVVWRQVRILIRMQIIARKKGQVSSEKMMEENHGPTS